jgi:hypothetical protein
MIGDEGRNEFTRAREGHFGDRWRNRRGSLRHEIFEEFGNFDDARRTA